jgi:hypothetical protein
MNSPHSDGDRPRGDSIASKRHVIEVRLREARQLFDALDPSPFREKDLDRDAEEFIVGSAVELAAGPPTALLIYLEQPTGLADEGRAIGDAVRAHFGRRASLLRRDLRRLIRRGLISLLIGLGFLATLFAAARLIDRSKADSALTSLLKESLVIGGWVAMWRPLEIFLYDWWPILGEQRTYSALSRIAVRVIQVDQQAKDDLARILTESRADPQAATHDR